MICLYLHDAKIARRLIEFLVSQNLADADKGIKLLLNVYEAKMSEDAADLNEASKE